MIGQGDVWMGSEDNKGGLADACNGVGGAVASPAEERVAVAVAADGWRDQLREAGFEASRLSAHSARFRTNES